MKNYFINTELKLSSSILMFLMIIFLCLQAFILKLHHDELKADYIKSLGAITVRVVNKNPELEKEIMPIITKEVSQEEADKGRVLLNQYGVNKDLESEIFPYVNKTIRKNNYTVIFLFLSMSAMFFIFNYFQYIFFYKRIGKLTIGAKKVIEGDYDLAINENKEGEFSKLASSFNSMREIIRNNIAALKNEKQFLVDLLSDISHQLKTPLSSMIVYNDILLSKELSREQRETFLLNNQNQLNRMNWLIKSMLKLAKLDAKAIEFSKEKQSLNETVQDSIDALESKARQSNIKIVLKEISEMIFPHDKLWVEEALINIIKNSIEHTPEEGEIIIKLTENPIYRRITIEDTGEGIDEKDLPHIFKRFYKAKTSRKSDSVGIGLALAKSIIEGHNGTIEAESKVREGTKFIVTFLKY